MLIWNVRNESVCRFGGAGIRRRDRCQRNEMQCYQAAGAASIEIDLRVSARLPSLPPRLGDPCLSIALPLVHMQTRLASFGGYSTPIIIPCVT